MIVHYATQTQEMDFTVNNFYHDVARVISKEPANVGMVEITCDGHKVQYMVQPRSGTMFITEVFNDLPDSFLDMAVKPRYLTCVDASKNAYKFYKLEKSGADVKASYGRMGVEKGKLFGERSYCYPLSMFWIKYYEKIGKGYVDRSDLYLSATPQKEVKQTDPKEEVPKTGNTASGTLFQKLLSFAKKAVLEAKVSVPITQAILDAASGLIDQLRKASTVEEFNNTLFELISILQRPVRTGDGSGVRRLMAGEKSDFARIIKRESDLLMAMEGVFQKKGHTMKKTEDFTQFDVQVFKATEKQKQQVMSHLSDTLKPKVKEIYRVIPKQQQEQFDRYLKKHNIKKCKQLWHGSRNQNWLSIIKKGLLLNPDAIITGKMFGQGVYFAPSSMKSWNYTSYHGTSWAGGNSDCAFMGLYAVAYGTPYDVNTWDSQTDYREEMKKRNCDCVHAHAGASLRNDEIIFYDEAATVLNYIVEFH